MLFCKYPYFNLKHTHLWLILPCVLHNICETSLSISFSVFTLFFHIPFHNILNFYPCFFCHFVQDQRKQHWHQYQLLTLLIVSKSSHSLILHRSRTLYSSISFGEVLLTVFTVLPRYPLSFIAFSLL